ncbi:succinyldiaminopimelate transaminase [Agromyces cerinus]|uniref:Succinyldiaminopimelate aminotransferase apoenzyme n=1 Tax=Agromyces cerinus subsp. cerinus TaxID=232089 RepID=A0A1N6HMS9_9MICO|nr:succinyldiaminopimelate transaminase [Agromyces cerinus]SIO21071.1 succinyldiaminopimelate aminotransferase apoenzyme [Agromyces cerinus subsp. cerinus]
MARGELPDYPWDLMAPFRERAAAHPEGVVDLSIGSPVDPTPALVREALANATDAHAYPQTTGTDELRGAIIDWFARRRGVTGLTEANVLPTVGSKELVALLPFLLGLGEGDVVVHPRAAYPSYEMGAVLVGATSMASDDPAEWPAATKLVWLNSPGNPDGRVLTIDELRAARERALELDAIIVGDECYAELGWDGEWADAPIPSLLDPRVVGDSRRNTIVAYSLSKQSNMAGYRTAFIAGCRTVIGRITTVRKHAGLMLPQPLQAAMIAALRDDEHVAEQKARYRARRELLKPALEAAGFRVDRSEAGLYLWATEGRDGWDSIGRLADLGIVAGPGHFYGVHHPEHVRLSLTATDERIAAAAERLRAAAAA